MPEIKNLGTQLLYSTPAAASIFFAGAAFYLSEGDPIVRQQLESKKLQLQHWSKMYSLGLVAMPIVALIGTGTAIAAYVKTKENYWLYGAATLFSLFPYTMFAIMPLNHQLNGILKESEGEIEESKVSKVVQGMKKWTKLHRVRAILAVGAAGFFFIARQLTNNKVV